MAVFHTPLHWTRQSAAIRWNINLTFSVEKLEWCDRRIDERTDGRTSCDNVVRAAQSIVR